MSEWNIRGLSLSRPWPFAFVNGPADEQKRVENRTWKPPQALIGHYIALHAAKSWSEQDRSFIASSMGIHVPNRSDSPHSEIFAVCRLAGYIMTADDSRLALQQRKWFFGPYGWLFEELVALATPVRCAGAQGLWGFGSKPVVLARLRESYRESVARIS